MSDSPPNSPRNSSSNSAPDSASPCESPHPPNIPKRLLSDPSAVIFAVVCVCIVMVSVVFHWSRAIQSDVAWLLHGASILFQGGNFLDDFYETNPPYNTVFYIPVILIKTYGGLSLHHAFLAYIIPMTVVLCWFIHGILRRIIATLPAQDHEDYTVILRAWTAMLLYFSLILTHDHLGQRDVLAGLGTIPVCLAIYLRSLYPAACSGAALPASTHTSSSSSSSSFCTSFPSPFLCAGAVAAGTLVTLLKPHWGVFIIAAFAHRLWTQKRITIIFDLDFLIISLLTASYLLGSLAFYPEFFTFLLPDILRFYVTSVLQGPEIIFLIGLSIAAAPWACYVVAKDCGLPRAYIKSFFWLGIGAFIGVLPALLQMKGLAYHFLVGAYFSVGALFLAFFAMLRIFLVKKNLRYPTLWAMVPLITLMVFLGDVAYSRSDRPEYYAHAPMTELIQKYSQEGDSYFIFFENMGAIFPTNIYVNRAYGSRFATFWFVIKLLEMEQESHPDFEYYHAKYAHLFTDDLRRHKPKVILLQRDILYDDPKAGTQKEANPLALFERNEAFREEWSHYKLAEQAIYPRSSYIFMHKIRYGKTDVILDVYVRQD